MSKYDATLTPKERQQRLRRNEVMRLWASHQGWPAGGWPKERRHDAIQIQHYVRLVGLPADFWVRAFGRVPLGAAFRFLTTRPTPGRVSLLEELQRDYAQERRRDEQQRAEATAAELEHLDPVAKARADEMVRDLAKRMRMKVA